MIVVVVDFVLFFVVKNTVFVYSASLSEHDTQWDETVGNRRNVIHSQEPLCHKLGSERAYERGGAREGSDQCRASE